MKVLIYQRTTNATDETVTSNFQYTGIRCAHYCDKRSRINIIIYYYLVCEAIGTAATPGLLCQPRVIMKMIVEQMKCRLTAGETEVLGENLPQRHFCPLQNPTWPDPGLNTGRRGGKPATNCLSYGAALSAKLVPTFAGKGCCVVSATNSHGR
jgi:hypothetical protein